MNGFKRSFFTSAAFATAIFASCYFGYLANADEEIGVDKPVTCTENAAKDGCTTETKGKACKNITPPYFGTCSWNNSDHCFCLKNQ